MLMRLNLLIDFPDTPADWGAIQAHIHPDLLRNGLEAYPDNSAADSRHTPVCRSLDIGHRDRLSPGPQPDYTRSFFAFLQAQADFLRRQGAADICLWLWVYYADHCHFSAYTPEQSALLARYAVATPVSIVRMSAEELEDLAALPLSMD